MKIAILSDAHGNKYFFDECLKKINELNVSRIFCLGDMFGYLPDGKYIMRKLREANAIILKGNHEAMMCGELPLDPVKDVVYGLLKQRALLNNDDKEFLKSLNVEHEFYLDGQQFLFVHGAPYDALCGYLYENDSEYDWRENYSYIFMGHTHYPYIKKMGHTTFVNVGSCGLPRDIGLEPCFGIYDSDKQEVKIIRCKINEAILEEKYFAELDVKLLNVFRRKRS